MQATMVSVGNTIDFTNGGTALAAGTVHTIGGISGIIKSDVPANAKGTMHISGIARIVKTNANLNAVGALVYWDADGDPLGGTAGSGAAVTVSTSNGLLGRTIETAAADVGSVLVKLWG